MDLKSKVLRTVGLASFLRSFGYGTLWSFVILYLTTQVHLSLAFTGAYLLFSGLIGALMQVIFGAYSDYIGRKIFLGIGQLGQGISFIFVGVGMIFNFYLILLGILLQSIFSGMIFSMFNALIADVFTEEERFKSFGIQRALANFGWGIGPAIGGFIFEIHYFSISFILMGFMLSLVTILMINIPETAKRSMSMKLKDIPSALKNKKFLIYSIAGFISFLIFGQLNSTYPYYENQVNGIPVSIIGLTWTMNGLMVAALQYPFARLANKKNAHYFLIYGIILYGFGYFMVVLLPTIEWMFLSMVVITFGEIIYSSSATTTAMNLAPEGEKGRYSGTFGLFTSVGRAAGPFYGGLIFSISLNYEIKWLIILITAIISSFLYILIFIKK
ncbi:MAG: MFS transporter [Thermoplasmata archaeon]